MEEIQLPSLGRLDAVGGTPLQEDLREDYELRVRKVRDEKVARACGFVADPIDAAPTLPASSAPYAALHCLSGYAFGHSILHAEAIPVLARQSGCEAVAIADPFSLVGALEFARSAKRVGIQPLIGSSFELDVGGSIVLIARSKRGYRALSQLITACHLEEPRGFPLLTRDRLRRHAADLICLTGGDGGPVNRRLMGNHLQEAEKILKELAEDLGSENVYVQIERSFLPWEPRTNRLLEHLAAKLRLPILAAAPCTHARRDQFPAQDVLLCAHTLCRVEEILGRKNPRAPGQPEVARTPERFLNAERFLLSSAEFHERYQDHPEWISAGLELAGKCDADVLPGRAPMPSLYEDDPHALREIVLQGALARYPRIERPLKRRIEMELNRIVELGFSSHFLVAHDFCRWSEEQGIQFSGRGSVVDSVVAYCLGFSRIDAHAHRLHFDRFLPADGTKRPDIDIDFEAHRRDDVRNYVTRKYGKDRTATVAAVGAYMTRGIIREVGKAMGLNDDAIGFLAKRLHGSVSADQMESAIERKPELRNSGIPTERFRWVFRLAKDLMDIPRNIRCHSSGVVVSSEPLADYVPLMGSASPGLEEGEDLRILQWDKRSAKHCFDKFDILCLRGQDVLSGVQSRVRESRKEFDVQAVPIDDPEIFRAMRSGELIGIPQSASPAMRQAHVRLRTENLHDASLVQAGIRPGVGGAVKMNSLIQRRRGLEPYSFAHPKLEEILGLTYGIIVFQEQVDQLLQTFGGYTSDEAEEIRDLIHKRRREDYGETIREEMIGRVLANGYSRQIAEQVFEYVRGFKGYGFAQGHALAFAEISIRSIYLQKNYPAEYFASLLAAQPAGYYGPCTIANEARSRGVAILPVDVDASRDGFTVEPVRSLDRPSLVLPSGGIRTGFCQVAGLSKGLRERIAFHQGLLPGEEVSPLPSRPFATGEGMGVRGFFRSAFDFTARTQPKRDELEALILCGAFDRLHPNRRALLWAVPRLMEFAQASVIRPGSLPLETPDPPLPEGIQDFSLEEKCVYERSLCGMDFDAHLMRFERERVSSRGGITVRECKALPAGRKAIVVGNPIRLRFPPTPSGKRVVFFDLEDETGLLNTTCFDAVYQQDGHSIVCSPYVTVIGEVQDRDGHKAFLAKRVFPYRPVLESRIRGAQPLPAVTADFLVG